MDYPVNRIFCFTAMLTFLVLSPVTAALAEGPALLTISGAISQSNRAPVTEKSEGMFAQNDITFEKGYQFDFQALLALPQTSYEDKAAGSAGTYRGPLLMDTLDWVGAEGDLFTLTGLDGYQVDIERSTVRQYQPIVAITRDGKPMPIGGFGPVKLQFPATGDADIDKKLRGQGVWALFSIEIRHTTKATDN